MDFGVAREAIHWEGVSSHLKELITTAEKPFTGRECRVTSKS